MNAESRSDNQVNRRHPIAGLFESVGYAVVIAVVFVLLLEAFAAGYYKLYAPWRLHRVLSRTAGFDMPCRGKGSSCRSSNILDVYSSSPAYAGSDWAEHYWAEERKRRDPASIEYRPFVVWQDREFHGSDVNVDRSDNGNLRRTISPRSCGEGPKKVIWFMGGSFVFGPTVPDSETIASLVAQRLASESTCYVVLNRAAEGYNSSQELIQLTDLLTRGERPDLIVMMDGFNDVWSGAIDPALPYAHREFREVQRRVDVGPTLADWVYEHSNAVHFVANGLRKFQKSRTDGVAERPRSVRVRLTLEAYVHNLTMIRALARQNGFEVLAFWQPVLYYGKKPLVPYESSLVERLDLQSLTPVEELAVTREIYAQAESVSSSTLDFVFLGHLFDGEREPLYVDPVHLGSRGNGLVADAITPLIKERLQPRPGRQADLHGR